MPQLRKKPRCGISYHTHRRHEGLTSRGRERTRVPMPTLLRRARSAADEMALDAPSRSRKVLGNEPECPDSRRFALG